MRALKCLRNIEIIRKKQGRAVDMNILNKQIDSIYDRQKNLYSKYPHYSQQNAESKKVCEQEKITATSGKDVLGITKGDKENSYIVHFSDSAMVSRAVARDMLRSMVKRWN